MKQDQFELTTYKTSRKFSILVAFFAISMYIYGFINNANLVLYISYFLMFTLFLSVIDSFDKRPILIVDKNGIWSVMKNKKTSWRIIACYNTTQLTHVDNLDSYRIDLYFKNNERIKITWSDADQSFDDVRKAILKYSSEYDIIDKGHKENDQPLEPWLPSSS